MNESGRTNGNSIFFLWVVSSYDDMPDINGIKKSTEEWIRIAKIDYHCHLRVSFHFYYY